MRPCGKTDLLRNGSGKLDAKYECVFLFVFELLKSSTCNALLVTWPLEYIIYTASIPSAMTGADVAIFASAFAYISDVSSVENRTFRVTILDACYLSTMPLGVALGSYLFTYVVNQSFMVMFSLNASLLVLSIIYTVLHLKVTLPNSDFQFGPLPNNQLRL